MVDDMKKIGLIAGGGQLPLEFVKRAKSRGEKIIVFALQGMALSDIEKEADKVYWLRIGQYAKFAFLLVKEKVRHLAMLGKVNKNVLYREEYEMEAKNSLDKLKTKKDYSILREVTRHLSKIGVEVIDPAKYLEHLIPQKGVLSHVSPSESIKKDIEFGYSAAKQLADMDIGQTVIVKDKTIVAVEAMEGTDVVIERANEIAGRGCVMVKVSRTNQDPRWDVPTVGPDTMKKLVENKFSALALEHAKMFLIDKAEMVDIADGNGIVLQVI
ncbi:MAG: UDP-2,3-diacylglucosamine diphosphatase LpxI [Candidatus Omnitrophica bacterium]|nr:UDP-2,3-diacylglucosamine diphosphatase LpxI [Candidatus Omnitrophota bacterium]